MGRSSLPTQVFSVVSLVAVGAALLVLARPAAGKETEKVTSASAPPRVAAAVPAGALPVSAVDPAPRPASIVEPDGARAPRGFLVLKGIRGRTITVRARPGGAVVARLGARTEFGSRTTLSVAATRGRWLGVVTSVLPNGRLGWVDPDESAFARERTRVKVTIDLSARRLVVRRGARVLRRMTVAVGRPSSPTPTGRFAVTDKLDGSRYSAVYGCCIVALTAHQPKLPAGWRGGDRIAVHGTADPGSIGRAVSAGCPRASAADMRFLMRVLPLGAPVVVRS